MITTHPVAEAAIEHALKEIGKKPYIRAKTVLYRIEE